VTGVAPGFGYHGTGDAMSTQATGKPSTKEIRNAENSLTEGRWPALSGVEVVPVGSLQPGDSPRTGSADFEHARVMAQSESVLPPIVVHRAGMRVIDGSHRLWAATMRGDEFIRVRYFEGAEHDAFVLAVRENTAHGLPLSLRERTAAAERIIASHGHWSDRAIADVAGLSAQTVGDIRRACADRVPPDRARLGRDGRVRPVNSSEGRIRAGKLIADMPDASLRRIAELAGISPGTVRDVRARLSRGESPVLDAMPAKSAGQNQGTHAQPAVRRGPDPEAPKEPQDCPPRVDLTAAVGVLVKDPSLKYVEHGRFLLRLLAANALPTNRWEEMADAVPGHSAALVSRIARVHAEAWTRFAEGVERNA
jgi:ParB-like chromosome segregation protein Spo0J